MSKKIEKEEKVETKKISSEEQKKSIIKTVSLGVGLIIVITIIFILTRTVGLSLEDQLNNSLEKMGKDYYTNFYYVELSKNKSTTEVATFLEKFSDIGIKINLDNLKDYENGKYKDEIAKFKNKEGKKCNTTSTRAIIYPKKPYGKTDYKIDVELDCGLDTETNK